MMTHRKHGTIIAESITSRIVYSLLILGAIFACKSGERPAPAPPQEPAPVPVSAAQAQPWPNLAGSWQHILTANGATWFLLTDSMRRVAGDTFAVITRADLTNPQKVTTYAELIDCATLRTKAITTRWYRPGEPVTVDTAKDWFAEWDSSTVIAGSPAHNKLSAMCRGALQRPSASWPSRTKAR